jgi:hypothetical protein
MSASRQAFQHRDRQELADSAYSRSNCQQPSASGKSRTLCRLSGLTASENPATGGTKTGIGVGELVPPSRVQERGSNHNAGNNIVRYLNNC